MKLTQEEFIKKSNEIHNEKYDYSKVEYINVRIKVKIICKKHNSEFMQTPISHISGHGCKRCGAIKSKAKVKEHISLTRKCPKCGIILKYSNGTACFYAETLGSVCKSCSVKGRPNKKKFTNEHILSLAKNVHNNKYTYPKQTIKGIDFDMLVECKEHGIFKQTVINHLYLKHGCKKCVIDEQRKTYEQFVAEAKKVHGDTYNYEKVKYKNAFTYVKIGCKIHGFFTQTPHGHLSGSGCSDCIWRGEARVKDILKEIFKGWKIKHHKKIWDKYKNYNSERCCDFFLEKDDIKIMLEYDGEQHSRPVKFNGISLYRAKKLFKRQKKVDRLDKQFCKENGIILFRIKYNQDKEKCIKKLYNKVSCYKKTN